MRTRDAAVLFVVLAVGAAALPGCGGLTPRERQMFDNGLRALGSGHWEEAEEIFRELARLRPDYTRTRLYHGEALFHTGRHDAALSEIEHALRGGGLEDPEMHKALYLKGRTLIEMGRRVVSDTRFRHHDVPAAEIREARGFFLPANVSLDAAGEYPGNRYEVVLWRAFALYRLENFDKAIDLLRDCARKKPGDWRHRFFRSLALEGLHGPNVQSVETALELARMPPAAEQLPLYTYLVDVYSEVPPHIAARIPPLVTAFRRSTGVESTAVDSFVSKLEQEMEQERKNVVLRQVLDRARELGDSEEFREALALLKHHESKEGDHPELTRLAEDIVERWSRILDLKAETQLRAEDHVSLKETIEEYQLARKMSSRLEVRIALQQKINDLRLALSHVTSSWKIRELGELLKAGEYQKIAEHGDLSLGGVKQADRDLYHYTKGAAHFRLGRWPDAADSFQKVEERTFDDIDLLEGLALIKIGQREKGLALLAQTPPQPGQDEVNRVLARHFAENGDPSRSLLYLDALEEMTRSDLKLLVDNRRDTGIALYEKGHYRAAVKELEQARKIVDTNLREHGADVYRYLGHAFFRLEQYSRAQKIYGDLINSDLTREERQRSRDAFLNLGRIHLRNKRHGRAYRNLKQYVALGGAVPDDLQNEYGRLTATFADYMPLDQVQYWNYTSTMHDYNYTLTVKSRKRGGYIVERKEAGNSHPEVWTRDGNFLVKQTGRKGAVSFRIPVNLDPTAKSLPFVKYKTGPDGRFDYTSEIVATNRTVELPDGKKYDGCLQVRVTRTIPVGTGRKQRTRYVIYLAPDVGEVKQEILQDEVKVAETVLSGIVFRKPDRRR